MEEWRPVGGLATHEISNHGRIRPPLPVLLKNGGYYMVDLGAGDWHYLHRLLAEAFLPREEGCECVEHINQAKTDNRLENLRWITGAYPPRATNPTGHKNIIVLPTGSFQVSVKRDNVYVIRKAYKTLADAIAGRDEILSRLLTNVRNDD